MGKRSFLHFAVIFMAAILGVLLGLNHNGTSIMKNGRILDLFVRSRKSESSETEKLETLKTRIPETKKNLRYSRTKKY